MRGVGAGRLALVFARDADAAGGTGAGGAGRALLVVDGAALTRDGAAPEMAAEDTAPSDPVDLVRNALRGGRRGVAGAGRRPPRRGLFLELSGFFFCAGPALISRPFT